VEITEKERLMLVKKKEVICGLTLEILALENDPKNALLIKQKVTTILSLISTIASYSDSKNYNLDGFRILADAMFGILIQPFEELERLKKASPELWRDVVYDIELFCNYANSVRFNFTKKGLKIVFPKITLPKNLNIGNITNK
jgi:hypothetical protein